MKGKAIISGLLLAFVTISLGVLIFKETVGRPAPATADAAPTPAVTVAVYYFHGNMRCATCKAIEAYTREAVESGFADDLHNGRLALKVINVEEPWNEHYVQDYQLSTRSVVLSRVENGRQTSWRNLTRIWDLAGDKVAFIRYVEDETAAMLKGGGDA